MFFFLLLFFIFCVWPCEGMSCLQQMNVGPLGAPVFTGLYGASNVSWIPLQTWDQVDEYEAIESFLASFT